MVTKIEFVEREVGTGNEHYKARQRTIAEVGYCKESPQEVLRTLFFKFFIGDYALKEENLEANNYLYRPDWKWVELIKPSEDKEWAIFYSKNSGVLLLQNFLSIRKQEPAFGTEVTASLEGLIRERGDLIAKARINPNQECYFYCDPHGRLIKFPGEHIFPTRKNLIKIAMLKMGFECPELENEPRMIYGKTSDETYCLVLAKRILAYEPAREVVEVLLEKKDIAPEEIVPYIRRRIPL
jgi:hypothetical protein